MGSSNVGIQNFVAKRLGSLWVVQQYLKRLGVQETIDSACPVEGHAKLTHGQVISVLVGNRLNSPAPLYQVGKWAQTYAADEVFGTPAALLNDDRIGRALDAISPHLETLKGSIGWQAIAEFGIDTAVWHWDFTSLSFHGAFEEQDPEGPQVTYGHSKARRPDLKQVMVGFGVTGDGAIPLHHTTVKGSTAEVGQVVTGFQKLKELAKRDNLIMVGDTKLISQPNIISACRAGVQFCAPAPASETFREVFLSIPAEEFQPLAYSSEREERKAPEDRSSFLGAERSWVVYDRKTKEAFSVRCIYVRSSEEQAACRANRARQMERAEGVLRKVEGNLGTRWYDTPEKVHDALKKGLQKLRMESFYTVQVGGMDGQPTLTWERNHATLAAAEALDGFYVLVTNLPSEYDPSQVLQLYKRQYRVERRFGDFKGPLTVSPMFLKDNRWIAALVFVVYLALLIYCLLEREARRALEDPEKARWTPYDRYGSKRRPTHAIHDPAESGKIRWVVGGPAERPTGSNLLQKLEWLSITLVKAGDQIHLVPPQIDDPLRKLHELIGVPLPFSV